MGLTMTLKGSRSALLACVALAGGVAVAGCGGGDDDGGGEELSRAALVRQANAACRRAAAGIARIPVAASIDELGSYAERVHTIGTRLYDEVSQLTPSQPDRQAFERYLRALSTSNAQLSALSRAADAGDRAAVGAAAGRVARAEVGTYAAVAGFDVCSEASPTPTS
ncbi:hypothetical protein VSS74_24095 [Conexibacter stalactiti]|uniref:Lipoprotein n=1 Tax=Conexibacter stalactiti TaxID=1940611 RepID=A0ABU4HVV2_9ACTN|nr:hypothetical protein [Conexibacter stalactiti]MDW5597452.1 hypothetical protein [Conexibacter stalactiti]MEC5038094.1 hypothetical protein [Conexibacter stalactiti]